MDEAFVFEIVANLGLEWFKIGQHVAVRNHYTLGFGGGAGSKDYFQDVGVIEFGRRIG